jgi:choline dehydrogenase-like flavoprotein
MIIDGRELPDGEALETDLCIFGAGAAGITLALEFAGRPVRVLIVESGGLDYDDAVQDLYNGEVVGLPYAIDAETRLRYFGGSTNHWGGLSRPFDPLVLARRDWVPHSGWPFGLDELEPYYAKAAELIEIGEISLDAAAWSARFGLPMFALDAETGLHNASFQQSPPTRFGERYQDQLLAAGNITIQLNTNLVELVAAAAGQRLEAARLRTLDGKGFTVKARTYVLACGGIENARLLLVSTGVEPAGLGNRHDQVGRYFMEHGHFHLGEVVLADSAFDAALYTDHQPLDNGSAVVFHISLTPEVQAAEKLLYGSLQLRPSAATPGELALRRIVASLGKGELPANLGRDLGSVLGDIGPVAGWLTDKLGHDLFGTKRGGGRLALRSESEQAPDPANRVTLTDQKDALGLPRVRLEWQLNELDLLTLNRTRERLATEFGRLGIGRVQIADDDGVPRYIQPGYHHIGTTRMADDPKQGVVDRDGRVHGIGNLYIAGSSVFPTSGDVTPTLNIVAVTLRLAAHLKAKAFA